MSAKVKLSLQSSTYAELLALLSFLAGKLTKDQMVVALATAGYRIEQFSEEQYSEQVKYIAEHVLLAIK